jgi:hypothetical protein
MSRSDRAPAASSSRHLQHHRQFEPHVRRHPRLDSGGGLRAQVGREQAGQFETTMRTYPGLANASTLCCDSAPAPVMAVNRSWMRFFAMLIASTSARASLAPATMASTAAPV